MGTRRRFVGGLLAAGTAPWWLGSLAQAVTPVSLLHRVIPSSGESIPVIGLGSSGSFEVGAGTAERAPLSEVLGGFVGGHGRLIDTSPNYGSAESVLGDLLAETGLIERVFMATKLAATGREAGRAQFATSQKRLRRERIDLLQVHNLRDWRTQIALAKELKAEGLVRYTGLTHYLDSAHEELLVAMQESRPDFVQINYSITQRQAADRIFPIAQDLGIAVLANRTFDDGALFARVRGLELPQSAKDLGIASFAQLFLRFALAEPAVTCVIPATGKIRNLRDNLEAGRGPMPDPATRQDWIAALNL